MGLTLREVCPNPGMRMMLAFVFLCKLLTAQQVDRPPGSLDVGANLPAQAVGPNDLIAVAVYAAPELSHAIRVGADGWIRLPMLKQRVKAEGLYPAGLETAIAEAIKNEHILVDPWVTVTIAEYHSRPISVAGAVRKPVVFQASTPVTLLEAIAPRPTYP